MQPDYVHKQRDHMGGEVKLKREIFNKDSVLP